MGQVIFDVLTYFIIYSFLGWILESLYRSFCERKLINTGFLRGPFCPIYGFGAAIMILILKQFDNNIILLFILSMLMLTAWEYLVGVILEKFFKTKYWDYSNHKVNFQGRICLTNSIYWGILGVVFLKYIHPFILNLLLLVDHKLLTYVLSIISLVFIVDMITTVMKVKNISATLEKIENINKEIRDKLKEIRAINKAKEEDIKTSTVENMQKMIEKLKKKRNRTVLRLYKNVYRLKNAFPAISTNEFTEVLNKKIELRRKKKKEKNKRNK